MNKESKLINSYIVALTLFHATIASDIVHQFLFLKIILLWQNSRNTFCEGRDNKYIRFAFYTVSVATTQFFSVVSQKLFLAQGLYRNRCGGNLESGSERLVRFDSQAKILLTPVS